MSSNSRAKPGTSIFDQVLDSKNNITEIYSIIRNLESSRIGTRSTFGTGRVSDLTANYLRNPTVVLTGIIALTSRVMTMATTTIDISIDQDPNVYTSRLILANGLGLDLETIIGTAKPGQFLEIQGVLTESIVIKDGVGNIRTQSGADVTITGNQIAQLRFDNIANEWVVFLDPAPGGGGGGGTFTDRIRGVMQVPESVIAYPDILSFGTGANTLKISGFVLPNTSTSTINCHVESTTNLAVSPNAKIRVAWINLGVGVSDSVVIRIRRLILAPGAQIPISGAFTNEASQQVTVADLTNTKGGTLISLTAQPAVDSTILYQIQRISTDINDTYTGDLLVYDTHLQIDRVTV